MFLLTAIFKHEFLVTAEDRGLQAILVAQEEEGPTNVEAGNVHVPVFMRLNAKAHWRGWSASGIPVRCSALFDDINACVLRAPPVVYRLL